MNKTKVKRAQAAAAMKDVPVVFILVQIWISLHFCTLVDAYDPLRGLNGAPIIDPFDQFLVIDVNTDKSIECKADKPIAWLSELLTSQDGNVNIINKVDEGSSSDHRYKSILQFDSITTEYVGKYFCVYNNTVKQGDQNYEPEVEKYKASSIYIYVDDPENLLVENHQHNFVIGKQFEPFVIPCKPTSPRVKLELIREDGEVQVEGSYDPEIGFTVSLGHVEESGFYDCRVRDQEDISIQFQVMVDENTLSNYLPPPTITSDSKFFSMEGNTFQLTCHIEVPGTTPYHAVFIHKGEEMKTNDYAVVSNLEHEKNETRKARLNLTITESIKERDEGDYKCTVMDFHKNTNSFTATMEFVTDPVVTLRPLNTEVTTEKGRKQAAFTVEYTAFPAASFYIYDPRNEQISCDMDVMNRHKYDVIIKDESVKFVVKRPDLNDFGNYTIVATTVGQNFTKTLRLTVSEKPTVSMEDVYVQAGEEVNMVCKILAFPRAEISWSFQPCQELSTWPTCGRQNGSSQDDEQVESQQASEISQMSAIKFTPSQPGFVKCKARNKYGSDSVQAQVKLGDLPRPFLISGLREEQQIAEGDTIKLECGAIIYNYSSEIVWRKDGEIIESSADLILEENNTKFSWRKTLTWKSIAHHDDGVYECEVFVRDIPELSEDLKVAIAVRDTQAPVITTNFNHSVMKQSLGDSLRLDCFVSGLPAPSLVWFKNDEVFTLGDVVTDENSMQRVMIDNNNSSIIFTVLRLEDAGTYKCVAWNRVGQDFKTLELEIPTPIADLNKGFIIGIACIILILVFLSIYLCAKVNREKKLVAAMKAAGLAHFEEGNLESFDPEVNMDEQADLLPYDKNVEFPREKLKLGKQLGAGAFGVVVKAIAQGIVPYEEESTVAVKMVKKQTDNEVMKALVSELKIMIHMGTHLNVVNLLGAVTKNIAKRELMVIVEYCQFGNLQSFLVKHRPYFVDQIRNDVIDPSIAKNDMRWSKNSTYNTYNSQGLKYISVAFANDKVTPKNHNYINLDANHYINCSDGNPYTSQPGARGVVNPSAHLNSKGYVRHSGFQNTVVDSCNTEATLLSNGQEDSAMMSNNSDQPLWRSNYAMDYKGPARSVCTSDLVLWSFQVARGMDYLASRKVLHGDLAARNILLAEDNVVKICDFGLARSMYKSENYKKQGEAPLPFKWLALESISDHVFSTYSDVWAFGVVLWELFTLGKVPYTGMEANQNLYYKLRDGYRMENPAFANRDIYDIMLNCWNAKPESRPLFGELERRLGALLHDSVKDHYVDLNEPYMMTNSNNYQTGRPDYLTQFSVPTSEAPKPPLAEEEIFYVNNSIEMKNLPSSNDYLAMSPKSSSARYNSNPAIKSEYTRPDSPTIAKNLDTSPKNKAKHPNKKTEFPEEIPMLRQNPKEELSDDDEQSPHEYTEMSFSNGQAEEQPEYKNLFDPSAENYVNMPVTNVANPSYITFQNINERH